MPTRDLSNKRITVGLGLVSQVLDPSAPTITECLTLLHASPAIRWNGLDFGVQASTKTDDRSLDDEATAQQRGFTQYGGGVPLFWPKATDTGSILRQAYNLLKTQGTDLIYVERVGWHSTSEEFAAYDDVNTYVITTDGFKPDTEGDGGYAYLLTMLAKGIAYPYTKIAPATPTAVTVTGGGAVTVGGVRLLNASYGGDDVTKRATWTSSDGTVAQVIGGIVVGLKAGTTNIVAKFPGATDSTALSVTVS